MSRSVATCPHVFDDGRPAWTPWTRVLRYTGKPDLEPAVARTCQLCQHRDEYAAILEDDTAPEG